jgi:translation initiation factor 2 subunit 1
MPQMPEVDELVFATVRKIMPYGAFCVLDEYGAREAFLHISEVAPRWIKNIHEFLHEGQHLVVKVYQIVPEKGQIDVSLKRVSDSERKRKTESTKRLRRAEKLFEVATKGSGAKPADISRAKAELEASFEDLYAALEAIASEGEAAVANLKIEKKVLSSLVETTQKAMKKAKAKVGGVLKVYSYAPDGVEKVRTLLTSISPPPGAEVSLTYIGAPQYKLLVLAADYKAASKALNDIIASARSKSSSTLFVEFTQGEGEKE